MRVSVMKMIVSPGDASEEVWTVRPHEVHTFGGPGYDRVRFGVEQRRCGGQVGQFPRRYEASLRTAIGQEEAHRMRLSKLTKGSLNALMLAIYRLTIFVDCFRHKRSDQLGLRIYKLIMHGLRYSLLSNKSYNILF